MPVQCVPLDQSLIIIKLKEKRKHYWVADAEYTAILQGKLLSRSQTMTSV